MNAECFCCRTIPKLFYMSLLLHLQSWEAIAINWAFFVSQTSKQKYYFFLLPNSWDCEVCLWPSHKCFQCGCLVLQITWQGSGMGDKNPTFYWRQLTLSCGKDGECSAGNDTALQGMMSAAWQYIPLVATLLCFPFVWVEFYCSLKFLLSGGGYACRENIKHEVEVFWACVGSCHLPLHPQIRAKCKNKALALKTFSRIHKITEECNSLVGEKSSPFCFGLENHKRKWKRQWALQSIGCAATLGGGSEDIARSQPGVERNLFWSKEKMWIPNFLPNARRCLHW